MDLSSNSELLRYANDHPDDDDEVNDSFYVVETETLGDKATSPKGTSLQPQSKSDRTIESELAAAVQSDSPECHISDVAENMDNLSSMSTAESDMSQIVKRLKEENTLLQNEIKKQHGHMKETMEQVRTVVADASRMREEDKATHEESRVKIEKLTKENELLRGQLVVLETGLASLQEKLATCESSEFITVDPVKEEQLTSANKKIEETHELLQLEKAQTDELKKLLRDMQLQQSNDTDKVTMVALNKKLVEKDEEMATLRTQLASSQGELERLSSELESQKRERDQLREQTERAVQEKSIVEAFVREIQNDFTRLQVEAKHSKEMCAKYQEEIKALSNSSRRPSSSSMEDKVTQDAEQVQILSVSLESSQIALEDAKKQLDDAINENLKLNALRLQLLKEIEELKAKLAKHTADHQLEVEASLIEKQQLLEQLQNRDSSFREVNMLRQKSEDICAKYKEKITLLKNEIIQLKGGVPSASDDCDNNDAENLRLEINKLDQKNSYLKTQIAALTTENESISHWKAQCELYEADYQRALSDKAALETKLAEMSTQLQELEAKDASQQKELSDLHQSHLRLAQEHVNGDLEDSTSSTGSSGSDSRGRNGDIPGQQLFNMLRRGVVNLLWDSGDVDDDQPAPPSPSVKPVAQQNSATSETTTAQPQPPEPANSNDAFSDLPPCPVCGRIFYSLDFLERHAVTCGDSSFLTATDSVYGSHLDPFVFVPQQ